LLKLLYLRLYSSNHLGLSQAVKQKKPTDYIWVEKYLRNHSNTPNNFKNQMLTSGFDGLGVSALAFCTQVRGFTPGRSRLIFQGQKNPQRAFLRKGSKTVGPMSLIYGM
jgi:hypothetical protein